MRYSPGCSDNRTQLPQGHDLQGLTRALHRDIRPPFGRPREPRCFCRPRGASSGTTSRPLGTPHESIPARPMTICAMSPSSTASTDPEIRSVRLVANRVTDKHREALGIMSRVPGTGVWGVTLTTARRSPMLLRFQPLDLGHTRADGDGAETPGPGIRRCIQYRSAARGALNVSGSTHRKLRVLRAARHPITACGPPPRLPRGS